jgi:hypothetical protein
VQQEVLPRVSMDVSYNRRWFENFFVDDNQLVGPADYSPWTYTAPADDRLPGGGNYPIVVYSITRDAALRGASTYRTFETDFGPARTQYWHGVNVNVNARMRNGLFFQGGTSTGRGVRDTCKTVVNIDSPDPRSCHVTEPYLTSFTGNASYTVPKVDVLVSAQFRSRNPANVGAVGAASASNGASLSANTLVPNSVVQHRHHLGQPAGDGSAVPRAAAESAGYAIRENRPVQQSTGRHRDRRLQHLQFEPHDRIRQQLRLFDKWRGLAPSDDDCAAEIRARELHVLLLTRGAGTISGAFGHLPDKGTREDPFVPSCLDQPLGPAPPWSADRVWAASATHPGRRGPVIPSVFVPSSISTMNTSSGTSHSHVMPSALAGVNPKRG